MQIEERFKQAETIKDINLIMRQLKAEGFDPAEVNNGAAKRRKEIMLLGSSFVSRLKKVIPSANKDANVKFVSFNVKPLHIGDNTVVIRKDGMEI